MMKAILKQVNQTFSKYLDGILFTSLTCCLLILQFNFIITERVFPFLDIDESGYLARAVQLHKTLETGGFLPFLESSLNGPAFAPLLPTSASLLFSVVGENPTLAILINAILFSLIAILTFVLVKDVAGNLAGWFAGIVILAVPEFIDFSRAFNFAVPVAFFGLLAIVAERKSENFTKLNWSLIVGLSLSGMVLSRTMAIAFVPAFVLGALLSIRIKKPKNKLAIRNFWTAFALGMGTAGIWYVPNAYAVAGYLFSFAYGPQSAEYGTRPPIWNPMSWIQYGRDFIDGVIYWPLALIFLIIIAIKVTQRFVPKIGKIPATRRNFWQDELFLTGIFGSGALLALISTKNSGSGFSLVLVPLLVILIASALHKINSKLISGVAIALSLGLLVATYVAKDSKNLTSQAIVFENPIIGNYPVLDPRSEYARYFQSGNQADTTSTSGSSSAWASAIDETIRVIKKQGENCRVDFGFRHTVFNVNSLELASGIAFGANFPARMVNPQVESQTVPSFSTWLSDKNGPQCLVLTSRGKSGEFSPFVETENLEKALALAQFSEILQKELPDGRLVKFWLAAKHD
jgi:hypothetical protein